MSDDLRETAQRKLSFFQTMKAVAWGFFGVRKGAGYRDTLALAARHIGGSMVAAVAQADALQLRQGSLAGLRLGDAAIEQRECHIVERIEPWQQVETLEYEANDPITRDGA